MAESDLFDYKHVQQSDNRKAQEAAIDLVRRLGPLDTLSFEIYCLGLPRDRGMKPDEHGLKMKT